jgi:hypothetical protein
MGDESAGIQHTMGPASVGWPGNLCLGIDRDQLTVNALIEVGIPDRDKLDQISHHIVHSHWRVGLTDELCAEVGDGMKG